MPTKKTLYNRIKIVLVEKGRTNKWLSERLGVQAQTVSRWCRNMQQPSIETLFEIAKVLDVDSRELIVSSKGNNK